MLLLSLASVSLYGCNNNADANADQAAQAGDDNKVSDDNALGNAVADVLSDEGETPASEDEGNPSEDNPGRGDLAQVSAATAEPKPIADRSPVEITRIEPVKDPEEDNVTEDNPFEEEEKHEVTPNIFPMDKCQVEVQGIYMVKLSKDLLKEINSRRADRGISPLAENPGLDACADSRCKELTYFVGHFRPNGSSFDSVGRGYVQGECIAVDYRTVKDIMEAWFAVNVSRYEIMNPEYTQVGISIYDIDDTYYIAAEFGY